MSLFGALLGDFDDDGFMGNQMANMNMQMRNINRYMNNMMMPDPFGMLSPFDGGFGGNNSLMERSPMLGGGLFGFPGMPNMNRLHADIGSNGASFCSSSVISMSSGPDGRPQIYQATSSTKTGPGGIRETRKTVQDSSSGVKKMAIGHHIGERAHIIEKEQNLRSGQHEERQEFINLDEEEAESFDREFTTKARMHTAAIGSGHHSPHHRHYQRALPALPAPPTANTRNSSLSPSSSSSSSSANKFTEISSTLAEKKIENAPQTSSNVSSASASVRRSALRNVPMVTPRRPLRSPSSSPLALTTSGYSSSSTTTSVHPHPYNNAAARRNFRSKHTKHQLQHQEETPVESNQQEQHKKEELQKQESH